MSYSISAAFITVESLHTTFTWLIKSQRGFFQPVCFAACIAPALSCGDARGLSPARWNENKQAVGSNHISWNMDMWMHQHICPSASTASGHCLPLPPHSTPGKYHRHTVKLALMGAVYSTREKTFFFLIYIDLPTTLCYGKMYAWKWQWPMPNKCWVFKRKKFAQ